MPEGDDLAGEGDQSLKKVESEDISASGRSAESDYRWRPFYSPPQTGFIFIHNRF